jgi:hypothetical protein
MGRACTICSSDNRHGIEIALAQRTPYRRIAAQYGVSMQALQRHGRNHPPASEMLTNGNYQQLPRARARAADTQPRVRVREQRLQARLAAAERRASPLLREVQAYRHAPQDAEES